ncbi:MAG: c-type cytochrome domain-containing protein, partial [Planctomycetota bacterium]
MSERIDRLWRLVVSRVGTVAALSLGVTGACHAEVKFNRDIRPILSDACFACHGPDEKHREAGLRLDTAEGAFAELDDGPAIVPGRPERSALYRRLVHEDVDERMPPADQHRQLADEEIELIRAWITEGAPYEGHWSTVPLEAPAVPESKHANPIDAFVSAGLESHGLDLSEQAAAHTLVRRLSFDLTGLPPRYPDVKAFAAAPSDEAYAKLVDRYLGSRRY